MIEFAEVYKKYGRKRAIHSMSFALEKGKIYGLVGPNGSGKSTTLKLIAGLAYPSEGNITVNGKKTDRKTAGAVAYLTELDTLYPSFTPKDLITFYDTQFSDFDQTRAYELLSFMSLESDTKIKHLSKGSRGRLKLVLALARDAEYLLLDEPFSGLDPMVRESIVKGLLTYIDFDKQTLLIATHEIAEIEALLDEVLVLQNGELIAHEEVEALREEKGLSIIEWMKVIFQSSAKRNEI